MTPVQCGVAVRDVTPPTGRAMSGFVARTETATGTHDPLTVRALCIDDTAVVTIDVVGLHEDTCAEIRRRCTLADGAVLVHATHTHGGPASMPRRLGGNIDPTWLASLVDICVAATDEARDHRVPAVVHAAYASEPGIATNRRHRDGPVDPMLPVVRIDAAGGGTLAVLTSYACHPVVLGPDNTLWTADFPGVVRRHLELLHPGAVALFLTGCAGDANTGHSAADSLTTGPSSRRTFAEAERVGLRIAQAAGAAELAPTTGPVCAAHATVALPLTSTPPDELTRQSTEWTAQADRPETLPAETALLQCWTDWAAGPARTVIPRWTARVTVLRWGAVCLVGLPGEPFAATGAGLRRAAEAAWATTVVVAGYTNGCPGYLPPRAEHDRGGYEVRHAHRYYGMPCAFDVSAAELLEACATRLAFQVAPEVPQEVVR